MISSGQKRPVYPSAQRDLSQNYTPQVGYYHERKAVRNTAHQFQDRPVVYDPDIELPQQRAQVDNKLKRRFESIFDKYERDFDEIGDEIDFYTNTIAVDRGHIQEMTNEIDAGLCRARRKPVKKLEDSASEGQESSEDELLRGSTDDEEEDVEEDEDDDDNMTEGTEESGTHGGTDMDEDDMILRGFAQANRLAQPSPELGTTIPSYDPRVSATTARPHQIAPTSTHTDILAQFGPQLGPQIVQYISQQEKVPEESHIEPAWRVPVLPHAAYINHSAPNRTAPPQEIERSTSPEAYGSLWAIAEPPVARRKSGPHAQSALRGQSTASGLTRPKRRRLNFTEEDDRIMIEWVAESQRAGYPLWSYNLWANLAAKYPHHSRVTWKRRYKYQYTYLWSNPEPITETVAADEAPNTLEHAAHSHPAAQTHTQRPSATRPTRIRRPAQQDTRIISWTEAVNTISSLDPELHAGLLYDSWLAEEGERSGRLERSVFPASRNFDSGTSVAKPLSISPIDQARQASPPSHKQPYKSTDSSKKRPARFSAPGRLPHPEALTPWKRAPCPHVQCRDDQETVYRLERKDDEDASPMMLHLSRTHGTTPFPCGEGKCPRKGDRGYFWQQDLVTHVRKEHPYPSALHRLRGRVDQSLLPLSADSAHHDTPVSSARHSSNRWHDSDFMSSKLQSHAYKSSDVNSSTPDRDTTQTPNRLDSRTGRMATTTPLTSISSLKVHPSSGTGLPRIEVRDSHEVSDQFFESEELYEGSHDFEPSRKLFGSTASLQSQLSSNPIPKALITSGDQIRIREVAINTRPVAAKNRRILDHHPENRSAEKSKNEDLTSYRQKNTVSETPERTRTPEQYQVSPTVRNPSPELHTSTAPTAFDSGNPHADPSFNSSIPSTQNNLTPRHSFRRNNVHPSHEFSDDEEVFLPVPKYSSPPKIIPVKPISSAESFTKTYPDGSAPFKQRIRHEAATNPAKVHGLTPAHALISAISDGQPTSMIKGATVNVPRTPATKRKAPRPSTTKKIIDEADVDELSLGPDDFIILGSVSRSTGQDTTQHMIKREGTVAPNVSVAPPASRKRRIVEVEADDEIDELGADEKFGKPIMGSQVKIKKEVDLEVTPMVQRVKIQRKEAKRAKRALLDPSSGAQRMGTPLLDLTPTNLLAPEADDYGSGDNGSSESRRVRAVGISSPAGGLLTPSRATKQSAIVARTPGGTFRKCGTGDFQCGKAFCFRCGDTGTTVSEKV